MLHSTVGPDQTPCCRLGIAKFELVVHNSDDMRSDDHPQLRYGCRPDAGPAEWVIRGNTLFFCTSTISES